MGARNRVGTRNRVVVPTRQPTEASETIHLNRLGSLNFYKFGLWKRADAEEEGVDVDLRAVEHYIVHVQRTGEGVRCREQEKLHRLLPPPHTTLTPRPPT
jgi:hypothetical protein